MPLTHDMDCGQRLRTGDEQVLEDVLRTCGPAVRSVLRRKYAGVLSLSDLDDVLAIGLFRLWVARERFDVAKGSLRVWFLRIADNAARDVLRHQQTGDQNIGVSGSERSRVAEDGANHRSSSGNCSATTDALKVARVA